MVAPATIAAAAAMVAVSSRGWAQGGPKGPMCVWVWVGGGGSRLSANLPAPGSRRPPPGARRRTPASVEATEAKSPKSQQKVTKKPGDDAKKSPKSQQKVTKKP